MTIEELESLNLPIEANGETVLYIEAAIDLWHILQREEQPAAQQSGTHRRQSAFDYRKQALAVVAH